MTTLTITICTVNRAELLRDCLQSIVVQEQLSDFRWSVLVVDNGSTDNTLGVCKEFENKLPGFQVVTEPKTGLSNARNRALDECESEWIAFIDDDATLDKEWLKVAAEEISLNRFSAFGGPYDAWHRFGPPPAWFDDRWESNIPNIPGGELPLTHFPTGGNCVIRMTDIDQLHFSPNLGMSLQRQGYGEETHFFTQMRDNGKILGWNIDLLIHHCVRTEKYSIRWRLASQFRRGRDYIHSQNLSPSFIRVGKKTFRIVLKSILLFIFMIVTFIFQNRETFLRIFVEQMQLHFNLFGNTVAEWRLFIKKTNQEAW